MVEETFIEMEKAAKALDLSDINLAAICLRKALEGHVAMAPPGPTPPADAVGPLAELSKAVNALEIKDFHLAALCCDKAVSSLDGQMDAVLVSQLAELAQTVRRQEFSSAAIALRAIIRLHRPDLTLPAPTAAVQPAVEFLHDEGEQDVPLQQIGLWQAEWRKQSAAGAVDEPASASLEQAPMLPRF
jgi:hypothetical protein